MGSQRAKEKFAVALIFLAFSFQFCFSQSTIRGTVKDSLDAKGVFANVVLKNTSGTIITYTMTESDGNFLLETVQEGQFLIQVSSLSYQTKHIEIEVSRKQPYTLTVFLRPNPVSLDEVVVHGIRPITVKKDTISIAAQSFAQGNEKVVEDLLRKIPGLNIDGEGTIKIGDQEVEKVMVEGDDFFEKGYKALTKNMPPQPIDKVEILQSYSNNRLLKDVEESDKVALNLTLKEEAKRVWFGNGNVGHDLTLKHRYDLKGNLMNFHKKNKYYFLANLNSIGYDATGDINHLIRPYRWDKPANMGNGQSVEQLVQLNANPLNFKQNRTNFNNAELISMNAIFNPTEKLKIKSLLFFNGDENQYFRNRSDSVNVIGANFTNTEKYTLNKAKRVFFGKTDLIHEPSKNQMLEVTTKYSLDVGENRGNLMFNNSPTMEHLDNRNRLFDQKLTYTNKIRDRSTLLLTGRYIDECSDQDYTVDNYLFQNLFADTDNVSNVQQSVKNNMTFAGFEAHLLHRNTNDDLIELKLGNAFRHDSLMSSLILLENQTPVAEPAGFQNDVGFQTNDLYLDGKYRYELNDLALVGKLEIHQISNQIGSGGDKQSQSSFFVNPTIGLDWKVNDRNRVKTSYAHNTTNLGLINVYHNWILNSFRSFGRGTDNFDQLGASTFLANHQFGNWNDRFFVNTFMAISKNHDFLSTNTLITSNYRLTESVVIKDRQQFNGNTNLDYYFKKLSSNLKIQLGYTRSEFKNMVNSTILRQVKSSEYRYGAEFRSAFNGFFNFNVGSKWTSNAITTSQKIKQTNNLSFVDLSFVFNEKWDAQIQTERYWFGNLETGNSYHFLDFDVRYQFKENKLLFELNGKNILNTKTFRNFSISDIGTTTTKYRLLPRFVLLKIEYRF